MLCFFVKAEVEIHKHMQSLVGEEREEFCQTDLYRLVKGEMVHSRMGLRTVGIVLGYFR